jgi:hypothetical protein
MAVRDGAWCNARRRVPLTQPVALPNPALVRAAIDVDRYLSFGRRQIKWDLAIRLSTGAVAWR